MEMNRIGKFDSLRIVNELDSALISLYGINMTDARITRYEALAIYGNTGCAIKAAEHFGARLGLAPLAKAA